MVDVGERIGEVGVEREDVVADLDAPGPAQYLVMPLQFGVVTAVNWALPVIGVRHGQHPSVSLGNHAASARHWAETLTASTADLSQA